jgi:predicted Zn finger-like uncharacterized protein
MNVTCPGCGAIYRVPEERLGEGKKIKVKCKKCGQLVDVVGGAPARPEVQVQPQVQAIWYVAAGKERRGPYPQEEILDMLQGGEIGPETFVWKKGMKDWTRLRDVQELAGLLKKPEPLPEEEPTVVTEAPSPAEEVAKVEEKEKSEPMVWQRRETSVLFSLEDYKAKKRTKTEEALIEVQPIGTKQAQQPQRRPSERIQVITLDEAEVKKVAEQLRAKKRRKTLLFGGVGAVVFVALAVVLAVFALKSGEKQEKTVGASTPQVAKSVQVPEQAVVSPKPTVQAPQQKQETKVEPRMPVQPVQPAATSETQEQKGKKTALKKEERQKPPTVEQKPVEPQKPATQPQEDVNALLAQLKKGQGGGEASNAEKKPEEPKKPAGGSEENLPEQLSTGQITSVMQKGRAGVASCLKNAGVQPGTSVMVKTKVEIAGSGRVVSAQVSGAQGAEDCIKGVLSNLKFPRFKGANMVVPYPFTVTP